MGFILSFFQSDGEEIVEETFCHEGTIFKAYTLELDKDTMKTDALIVIEWYTEQSNDPNNEINPTTLGGTLTFSESLEKNGILLKVGDSTQRIITASNWEIKRPFICELRNADTPYTHYYVEGSIGGVSVLFSFKTQINAPPRLRSDSFICRPYEPYRNPTR